MHDQRFDERSVAAAAHTLRARLVAALEAAENGDTIYAAELLRDLLQELDR